MNIIKGLILKDLQTIKSYKTTVLFILIIFTVTGFLNDGMSSFLPIFLPLCFGMLGISSFSYDNISKVDKYILTFPINKKDMVKARYIYILAITLFGALFGFILTTLVQYIKAGNMVSIELLGNNLALVFGALCGIILLQVFQIPIMYKFGAEKGRIIQMIMIVALMVGISLITTTVMKFFNISLDSMIIMLKQYLLAILGVGIVVFYILSYLISCRIYTKKEI